MKILDKPKEKKGKIRKNVKDKAKKDQVLIVAQEFKFARLLSGNEKKTRDKVLKTLKKWLLNCFEKQYEFKEDDFIRVWKGLFYAVWMSDKPLIQEELCENISGILDVFPEEHLGNALLMFKAGLRVLASEWYGLDQHRTDKFLMLVRRYLRASLRCLLRCKWSLESCQMYAKTISGTDGIFALKTPAYARNALSMLLHFIDCYLEEISKVSEGDIPGASLLELLRPLCDHLCGAVPALSAAARRLLSALLRQSEPGLRYWHATRAWHAMGCPEGGPEALELVTDDEESADEEGSADEEDEESEKPLDPRAGRVDVSLASLPVPAELLAELLRGLLSSASSKHHRRVRICLERFEQLARNEYPLRVSAPPPVSGDLPHKRSTHSLLALEKKLVTASDDLALRGLGRKHRKRLLAKSRSGASIVEDVVAAKQKLSTQVHKGWQVEVTEPAPKKHKQNTDNKENKKRKTEDTSDAPKPKVPKQNGDIKHKTKDKINSSIITKKLENNKKRIIDNINNAKGLTNKSKEKVKSIDSEQSDKVHEQKKVKDNNKKVDKTIKLVNGINKIQAKVTDNKINEKKSQKVKNANSPTLIVNNVKQIHKKPNNNFDTPIKLVNGHKNDVPTTEKTKMNENNSKKVKNPTVLVNKVKQIHKQSNNNFDTPKKVKFVLKNNSMQQPLDYYKSVRQSPNIPFDGTKQPSKTNLKPSTPSPINPFFKKKLKMRK